MSAKRWCIEKFATEHLWESTGEDYPIEFTYVLASDYNALDAERQVLVDSWHSVCAAKDERIAELERQRSELLTLRDIEFLGEKCQKCAALELFILWCIEKMKELEDARA